MKFFKSFLKSIKTICATCSVKVLGLNLSSARFSVWKLHVSPICAGVQFLMFPSKFQRHTVHIRLTGYSELSAG